MRLRNVRQLLETAAAVSGKLGKTLTGFSKFLDGVCSTLYEG